MEEQADNSSGDSDGFFSSMAQAEHAAGVEGKEVSPSSGFDDARDLELAVHNAPPLLFANNLTPTRTPRPSPLSRHPRTPCPVPASPRPHGPTAPRPHPLSVHPEKQGTTAARRLSREEMAELAENSSSMTEDGDRSSGVHDTDEVSGSRFSGRGTLVSRVVPNSQTPGLGLCRIVIRCRRLRAHKATRGARAASM